MPARYKQIPIDKATPGMVLSDDVLDKHGHVLLAQGVSVSEETLASLKRHGVTTVPVVSDEPPSADEEMDLAQREARLTYLFRKPADPENDATGLLEQYVRHYRLAETS